MLPKLDTGKTTIHETTCGHYLEALGFTLSEHKKDVYIDGHEREDVREYRERWIGRMLGLEKSMSLFEGEELKEVEPALEEGEKKVVQITHDECCFFAHDGMKKVWLQEGEQILRKKGEGQAFMVSGFLCPCHGVVAWST